MRAISQLVLPCLSQCTASASRSVKQRLDASRWIAAASSFVMFAIGAIVPLLPYLLGFASLWLGLACGGVGLLVTGGVAAYFTRKAVWRGSLRQLLFGAIAIGATYVVGMLIGTSVG